MLAASAFVPIPLVTDSFEMIFTSQFYEDYEVILQPLLEYFESTWIGTVGRGGKTSFPKVFQGIVELLPNYRRWFTKNQQLCRRLEQSFQFATGSSSSHNLE